MKKLLILPLFLVGFIFLTGISPLITAYADDEIIPEDTIVLTEDTTNYSQTLETLTQEYMSKFEQLSPEQMDYIFSLYSDGFDQVPVDHSDEEQNAIDIVNQIFDELGTAPRMEFNSFADELEFYLGRALTDEEKATLKAMDDFAAACIYDPGEEPFESDADYYQAILGRPITQAELDTMAAYSNLILEIGDNAIIKDLEVDLGRSLTNEEVEAWTLFFALENPEENVLVMNDNYVNCMIADYEYVLGRTLTTDEVAALNSLYN